jgi:GNAT superfamily N-acetyltransferase
LTDVCQIRPARQQDTGLLLSMIRELAGYERAADRVLGTEELLAAALFDPPPAAEAVIAAIEGEPVGFALFHGTFSTWLCQSGIWLEDLYVRPEHRGSGVGRALITHVARLGVQRGCGRVELSALDWNTPALQFYDRLGATRLDDWKGFRFEGDSLHRLADDARGEPAGR